MHTYLIDMLECPACHGELKWNISQRDKDRIEAAEARCSSCGATYPVRDGIGLFLTPDLPREDLWEQVDSGLIKELREHPELERQLMEGSLETLSPADRQFRALVLESRGDFIEGKRAETSANRDMYTPEYTDCSNKQMAYVVEQLSSRTDPIIDLASGRGYLVEKLLQSLKVPIVMTDFSPSVLRRDRRWLESFGFYERASLLAFDARKTPFQDGAIKDLTTYLGLPNIREQGELLRELRRIVTGVFLAVSHFFPEEDEANAAVIRETGLEQVVYRRAVLENFEAAGWAVEVQNACVGKASPTPPSAILEGARIDGLPVQDTTLEWCVLEATPNKPPPSAG